MKTENPFKFIGIDDTGPESGARCPHCGADGRYIYRWEYEGKIYGAMAGCYKMLTGTIEKGEKERYIELIAQKQSRNKELNSWDKSILRMLQFQKEGKYPDSWIENKIDEILR